MAFHSMAYKWWWVILTTYKSWDDPGMILQGASLGLQVDNLALIEAIYDYAIKTRKEQYQKIAENKHRGGIRMIIPPKRK